MHACTCTYVQGDGAKGDPQGLWVDVHQRAPRDRSRHGSLLLRPPRHQRRHLHQLPQPHPRRHLPHGRAAPRREAGGGDAGGPCQAGRHGRVRGGHHGGQPLQGPAAAPVADAPAPPRRRHGPAPPPQHAARHRLPVRQLPGLRALVHRAGPRRQGVPLQVHVHAAGLRLRHRPGARHRGRHPRGRPGLVAPLLGPAPPHRRLLGGLQHRRHLLPHLLGHRQARAHLPLHVQLPLARRHHRARLAAARHRRVRRQPARRPAHRTRTLRLPLGQKHRDEAPQTAAAAAAQRQRDDDHDDQRRRRPRLATKCMQYAW
jgi:hypothetical protein|uniref:Uncharacterized protein n=1 Tax=Zea mays TaxID=4577 RepID=A0A804U7A8_MAIZE